MSMFLDIAAEGQRGTAPFRGQKVDLFGLSARQIARMLVEHESVQVFVDGANMNLLQLVKMAPDAVAACIAYGTGYDDVDDKEKFARASSAAAKMSAGEQYDMLKAIFDVTFGERLNPFVKALLDRVLSRVGNAADKLPAPTNSQRPSRDSLRSVTTPEMFGAQPQDNSPGLQS